jgi:hypothetical protein
MATRAGRSLRTLDRRRQGSLEDRLEPDDAPGSGGLAELPRNPVAQGLEAPMR